MMELEFAAVRCVPGRRLQRRDLSRLAAKGCSSCHHPFAFPSGHRDRRNFHAKEPSLLALPGRSSEVRGEMVPCSAREKP